MKQALKLLAVVGLACGSGATAAPAPTPPPSPAPAPSPAPSPAPAQAPAPTPAPAPSPAPSPAAADACRPVGPVVFEIDHRVSPGAKAATSTTKVFTGGAWTRDDSDADGKAAPRQTGCLAKADAKQLETTLHGVPWKVTTARFRCMAVSADFTVVLVDGKQVFTQKLCSGQSLDDKSQAALDAATAQVNAAAKAP